MRLFGSKINDKADMLRLSDIRLHLNHTDEELNKAIIEKLNLADEDLLGFSIFKRSYDARKKTNIVLIYQLDVMLTTIAQCRVLEQYNDQPFLTLSPDNSYHFVAKNIENFPQDNQLNLHHCWLWSLWDFDRSAACPDGPQADCAGARARSASAHEGYLGNVAQT